MVSESMKLTADRPYSDPEKAARKLVEIAKSVEVVQDVLVPVLAIGIPKDRQPIGGAGRVVRT